MIVLISVCPGLPFTLPMEAVLVKRTCALLGLLGPSSSCDGVAVLSGGNMQTVDKDGPS